MSDFLFAHLFVFKGAHEIATIAIVAKFVTLEIKSLDYPSKLEILFYSEASNSNILNQTPILRDRL